MKKIERYLICEFLRIFLLAFFASLSLYLVVDFFERINMLVANEASLRISLLFFAYKIPLIVTQIAPIALLLAIVISLGNLNRRNELNALRSAGVKNSQIFRPFLLLGFSASIILLVFSETVLPAANFRMEYIKNVEIKKQKLGVFRAKEVWYRDGNEVIHIETVSPDRRHLGGIHIWSLTPELKIKKRFDASTADWNGEQWQTKSLLVRSRDSQETDLYRVSIETIAKLPLSQAPEDFALVVQNPEEMSFFKLRDFIRHLQDAGQDVQSLLVDLHAKISIPFLCLIVTMLGFPLGLRFGRQGGILLAVFLCLVAGFAFWIFLALGLSLGHAGSIPPLLGAWISHIIFAGAGIILFKLKN